MSYIYKILNKVNGKFYIGSTVNIKNRKYQHIHLLKKGKHQNNILQRAWNKYGEENFEFIILEDDIKKEKQFEKEQEYFAILNPFPPNGYNIATIANGGGNNKGTNVSTNVYSEEQILGVKKLICNGLKSVDISKITNVSQESICSVKRLRTWVDLGIEYNRKIEDINIIEDNKIKSKDITDEILDKAYGLKMNGMDIKEIHATLNLCSRILSRKLNIYSAKKKGKKIKCCVICNKEMILKSNNSNKKYCKECAKHIKYKKTKTNDEIINIKINKKSKIELRNDLLELNKDIIIDLYLNQYKSITIIIQNIKTKGIGLSTNDIKIKLKEWSIFDKDRKQCCTLTRKEG